MSLKKGDFLVVVFVLLAALGLLAVKALPATSGDRLLLVEINGKLHSEIPFNEDSEDLITVNLPGGHAIVEIVAGRVRVLPMEKHLCPLGICSAVGWIEQSGDAIVCLPNRLVMTVVGGDVNAVWDSVDGVTN